MGGQSNAYARRLRRHRRGLHRRLYQARPKKILRKYGETICAWIRSIKAEDGMMKDLRLIFQYSVMHSGAPLCLYRVGEAEVNEVNGNENFLLYR